MALTCVLCLLAGIALIALFARTFYMRWGVTPGSMARACVGACALVAVCAFGLAGNVECASAWPMPFLCAALVAASCAALAGPSIRAHMGRTAAEAARIAFVALCIPISFFLLEWPYNDALFHMGDAYVRLNLGLVGGACLASWFIFQRRSAGALSFAGACLAFGLANYFLCLFKGQTILPADVLAVGTAAQVSVGYTYVLQDAAVTALGVFALLAALAAFVPPAHPGRKGVALNLVVGLAIVASLVNWYDKHDLEEDFGVTVDVWATRASYQEFGSVACFLQRVQEIEPTQPDGYDAPAVADLQSSLAAAWDAAHAGYPQTLAEARSYQQALTGTDDLPTVVVVMNESFADLSSYPGLAGYAGTQAFDAIDAALRGSVYTSVRGGGTCNSEFEYLTGSTLATMGGGVYPYMLYDLSGTESLPAYFAQLGYATSAIHPGWPTNWRRDVVYGELGFDRFVSEPDFSTDTQTLRGLVTDAATYGAVLDVLAANESPQFVFDVTIQNHGGYQTGLVNSSAYKGATVNGTAIADLAEYLACIDASQDDLVAFLDELSALDRKVVLVFFGDHQPGFNDELAEAAYGAAVSDFDLDQVQQRFETPYLVWANYDLGLDLDSMGLGGENPDGTLDTSLNYLSALTAYAAGLPLTDYQKALLQLQSALSAVNLNGSRDADGTWWWNGWIEGDLPAARAADEAYDAYSLLQYANLFDSKGNGAFAAFGDAVQS